MPILLYRIDERLIHGQVVIGWGSDLRPDLYVVVDDTLAESDWEQEIYRLGVPDGAEVEFSTVAQARDSLGHWRGSDVRTVVLTRDVENMLGLARGGLLEGERVNVGGIYHAPGRTQVLRYVHLTPEEREGLRELSREGARVQARDLPGASPVSLDALVGG